MLVDRIVDQLMKREVVGFQVKRYLPKSSEVSGMEKVCGELIALSSAVRTKD